MVGYGLLPWFRALFKLVKPAPIELSGRRVKSHHHYRQLQATVVPESFYLKWELQSRLEVTRVCRFQLSQEHQPSCMAALVEHLHLFIDTVIRNKRTNYPLRGEQCCKRPS